jgi:hypothetical protein
VDFAYPRGRTVGGGGLMATFTAAVRFEGYPLRRITAREGEDMHCYICQDGWGSVGLAECGKAGPRGVCGGVARVCRACAKADVDELERARERWQEEHACSRPVLAVTPAQRYLERGLADLHSARVRLESAGYPMRARELSERLKPIEELHALVKAGNEGGGAPPGGEAA